MSIKPFHPEEDASLVEMTPEETRIYEKLCDMTQEILPPYWHYAAIILIPDPNMVRDLITGQLPPGYYQPKRGNTITNLEDEALIDFLENWLRKAKLLLTQKRAHG